MNANRMILAVALLGATQLVLAPIHGQSVACVLDQVDRSLLLCDRDDSWSNFVADRDDKTPFLSDLENLWSEDGQTGANRRTGVFEPPLMSLAANAPTMKTIELPSKSDVPGPIQGTLAAEVVDLILPWVSGVFGLVGFTLVICGLLTRRWTASPKVTHLVLYPRAAGTPNHWQRWKEQQRRRAA